MDLELYSIVLFVLFFLSFRKLCQRAHRLISFRYVLLLPAFHLYLSTMKVHGVEPCNERGWEFIHVLTFSLECITKKKKKGCKYSVSQSNSFWWYLTSIISLLFLSLPRHDRSFLYYLHCSLVSKRICAMFNPFQSLCWFAVDTDFSLTFFRYCLNIKLNISLITLHSVVLVSLFHSCSEWYSCTRWDVNRHSL